ncbi:unnamed protein product [Chondrus crispus]|uniref:Uncharacterized protein n=1 Tax=Chondrus crispus TaxID=2769 RepID=R7Q690_CHOCR|nr:unnamed protein product [Chondrus crispus]CDF34047.1 unnamed protein product [Chondrus crispus]|eukprot:XP_005713866.1 unnamed protein product [Chondrus crispus]
MDVAGCDEILRVDPELRAIAKVLQTSGSHSSTASEALGVVYNVVVGKGTASLSTTCAEQILSSILSFLDRTHRYLSKYDACHEICLATTCSVVHTTDKVKEQLSLKLRQQLVAASLKYSQKYMSFKSPLSPSIVTNACTCIRVLVVDSETRAEFANTDGNGPCTLVKCVTFLSERPLQVEHALLALGNAVFDSSRGKEQVRLSGGIQVVLDVINRNYFVASVAEASLLAIQGICTQDDSSGNLATTLKVHGACVRTMNSFRDNPAIQERALAAMLSFGTDGEAVRELKALSVLDIAATAAAAFPFSKLIAAQEHQLRWLVKGDDVGPTRPSHDRLERLKSLPLRTWKSFTRG